MGISKRVVNRPTTFIIIFALLVGLGLYIAGKIPVALLPEIDPPTIVIYTDYSGAGPEEVEQSVTRIMEGILSNVSHVQRISSNSSEGSSQIMLEFSWGIDLTEATNEIRDKLGLVKDYLPEGVDTFQVIKVDPDLIPILQLAIKGKRSPDELLKTTEDIIQPGIEQVDGVALTVLRGGRERVIRVEIPENRLEAYDLSLVQVAAMLRSQNVELGAGNVKEGSKNYFIRTSGAFASIEDIRETVVAQRGGGRKAGLASGPGAGSGYSPPVLVRLRDIANVYEGYRDQADAVFINGEQGIYLSVHKQSGKNSVQIAERVLKRVDQLNRQLHGVEVAVISDTTAIIRASIDQVASSAFYGGLFAIAVLFIFLRRFKSTLVVALSIPIALLVTMLALYFAGRTLNIMSMAGLVLGLGMIVDSSIVILENIHHYREKGAKLKPASILGGQEMINAITASILTTACVFLPLIIFRNQLDMLGVLFSDLTFTVIISLLASLAIAIFLVPVLTSKYLPLYTNRQKPLKNRVLRSLDKLLENFFISLEGFYQQALGGVLRHRWLTIFIVLIILGGSLLLVPLIGFEFIPSVEEDLVKVNVALPVGTSLDVTKQVLKQLTRKVANDLSSYRDIIVTAGEKETFFAEPVAHTGSLTITLPEYANRKESSSQVKEKIRAYFDDFPGVRFSFAAGSITSRLLGGGSGAADIIIKTNDLQRGKETAQTLQKLIVENIPQITEPKISLGEGLPQLDIVINRQKATALGLNMASISQELRASLDGLTATIFRSAGEELDVLVALDPADRQSLADLQKIFMLNSLGQPVSVSSFASLEKTAGPVAIQREDQIRTIHVSGGLVPGAKINEVQEQIEKLVAGAIIQDEGLLIEYGGDFAGINQYGSLLITIIVMAVLLVFGVMASQFESFKDPFIMFFTIPLMFIGVIGIHLATGKPFSTFTALGLIMLAGIVVNNGIVLVDYTNLLMKRGLKISEACIAAGGNRLRPVLMTTLTTILGMLPMAFFPGEGSDLLQPIGQTVIGGLAMSTLITLFLIPVIFSLFNECYQGARASSQAGKQIKNNGGKSDEAH